MINTPYTIFAEKKNFAIWKKEVKAKVSSLTMIKKKLQKRESFWQTG